MTAKRTCMAISALLLAIMASKTIYADIYEVPKSDTPIAKEQYNEKISLEANGTTNQYIPQGLPDNEGTVDPYTSRNVSPNSVRTNIIQNNFVDVTVLKASPGKIANDTEDLLSGRESDIVSAPDSKAGQSGLSIKGNGDIDDLQ